MFGPAHQRVNEVDSEPPTASLHDAYYVKVGSPLPSLPFQPLSSPSWFTKEAAIADFDASTVDITPL
jgi:hypothetical protein